MNCLPAFWFLMGMGVAFLTSAAICFVTVAILVRRRDRP